VPSPGHRQPRPASSPIDALEAPIGAWLTERFGPVQDVEINPPTLLAGAVSGAERIEVAAIAHGRPVSMAFVRKYPPPWTKEIEALELVAELDDPDHVWPTLVGSGTDERGRWLLLPCYPGRSPAPDEVPGALFEALARLHAHFLDDGRVRSLVGPPDVWAWWQFLCTGCVSGLASAPGRQPRHDDVVTLIEAVERWGSDLRVADSLALLPLTLTHRDVHLGNLVCDGEWCRLIDWGNASWGAPLVDLANVTTRNSAGVAAYLRVYQEATGELVDPWLVDLGWEFATMQVRVTYLPWGFHSGDLDRCLAMVAEGEAALAGLGRLLSDRP
jgi:hypothetical protein